MTFKQVYGLGLLFTINTLNFLDRISVAAVLDSIEKYYGFTKTQNGLLSFCFLFGYMFTAPVFGYLGDKYSRKWILVGGIAFWCAAAASGFLVSANYSALLFVSRTLVGVGEASYSTIAPTIIADLFGPDKRKLALSIFYFAIPIGTGLGFFVGNAALSLGDWRFIFLITPSIGVVCVFLLMLLEEPVRGQAEGGGAIVDNDNSTVFQSVYGNIKYLLKIKSYVYATLGFTCCLFATGALSWLSIQFFKLAVGDSYEKQAQLNFGIVVAAAGFGGVSLGSAGAQYWRKYDSRADPLVCALGVFLAVPFTCFALTTARSCTSLSWFLMFLSVTSLSTNWAVISDMLLSVTMPSKRAFATAMQIFTSHLFGDAASPVIIGSISEYLHSFKNENNQPMFDEYESLLFALELVLIPLIMGALIFWFCARYYAQDVDSCKIQMEKNLDLSQSEPGSTPNARLNSANLTDFANMS